LFQFYFLVFIKHFSITITFIKTSIQQQKYKEGDEWEAILTYESIKPLILSKMRFLGLCREENQDTKQSSNEKRFLPNVTNADVEEA
jgi:hypothetical protein